MLVCLLLILIGHTVSHDECYSIDTQPIHVGQMFEDHCYTYFDSPKLNFTEARLYCKSNFHPNSDLTKIPTIEVNGFLDTMRGQIDNLWIGLTTNDFSTWYWISDMTQTWTNWGSTEPSFDGLCVEMWNTGSGTWNDVGCERNREFFCSYEMYSCGNFSANDIDRVCSGHGICVSNNSCECDNCHEGPICEDYECKNIIWNNFTYVCNNGNGNCTSCDSCECFEGNNYYGMFCEEFIISNTTYNVEHSTMIVTYRVLTNIIPLEMKNTFSCSLILNETMDEFDLFGTCYFNGSSNVTTESLVIEVSESSHDLLINYDGTPSIYIITITSFENVYIPIHIVMHEESDDQFGDSDIVFIVVISIIGSICLLICIMFCIACIVFAVISKFKKINNHIDQISSINEMESKSLMAQIRINEDLFKVNYSDLKIQHSIGKGAYATVYLADWLDNKVAFKCFNSMFDTQGDFDLFEKEVAIVASIRHPNVVGFYGCTLNPPRVGILFEYCSNGNIKDYFINAVKTEYGRIDIKKKVSILRGIVSGMVHLHDKEVIHRDLKCENILLDKDFTPKITDFGLSKIFKDKNQTKTRSVGTCYYMAPEVCKGGKYNEKCDVFSFAIILYEIISLRFKPYGRDVSYFNIEMKIASDPNYRPDMNRLGLDTEEDGIKFDYLRNLIIQCWKHDPEERPSFLLVEEEFKRHNKKKQVKV